MIKGNAIAPHSKRLWRNTHLESYAHTEQASSTQLHHDTVHSTRLFMQSIVAKWLPHTHTTEWYLRPAQASRGSSNGPAATHARAHMHKALTGHRQQIKTLTHPASAGILATASPYLHTQSLACFLPSVCVSVLASTMCNCVFMIEVCVCVCDVSTQVSKCGGGEGSNNTRAHIRTTPTNTWTGELTRRVVAGGGS